MNNHIRGGIHKIRASGGGGGDGGGWISRRDDVQVRHRAQGLWSLQFARILLRSNTYSKAPYHFTTNPLSILTRGASAPASWDFILFYYSKGENHQVCL